MSNRKSRVRPALVVLSIVAPCLFAGLACTGNATVNTVLGSIANTAKQNTVMIRLSNDTLYNVEIELRVDGEMKLLPACTAQQRVCDYFLTKCPTVLEVIQETRRDANGAFMGGRHFETNPDFIFGPGEMECGDTLMLQVSETHATAQMM